MLLNCGVGEDSWESLGLQGDQTSQSWRKSVLNIHWKDWCWSWSSNSLAIWCEELTHWKRPWCWERLRAGGEGDDRGWDGWMASLTQWTWVWACSRSWWWTGEPGVMQSTGLQNAGHDWATNWTSKMPSIQFCDLFKDLLSSVGCVTFKGRFYVFNIILYIWWVVACWMFQLKCTEHDMFEK